MDRKRANALITRAVSLHDRIKRVRKLYDELDLIAAELNLMGFTRGVVDGRVVELTDQFATKNVIFRTTSVKRFELAVSDKLKGKK